MEQQKEKPCNPDDVVCQMEVLRHLKGLKEQLGNEAFLEKYPEGKTLIERLPQEITSQQERVDQVIGNCGRPEEEEIHVTPRSVTIEETPDEAEHEPPPPGEEQED